MRAFIFLGLLQGILCASVSKRANSCPQGCYEVYEPVCGTDGKTYSNSCFLSIATCKDSSVTQRHTGTCHGGHNARDVSAGCPMMLCGMIYMPVCGTDNKTYSNSCVLKSQNCNTGVTVASQGSCSGDILASR